MSKTLGCDVTGLSWGVFQTHQESESAEIAKCKDESGKVTDEAAISRTATETGTFVLNGAVPRAGTLLNLGGSEKLITQISTEKKNDGHATGSVTTEKSDSATQVPYA